MTNKNIVKASQFKHKFSLEADLDSGLVVVKKSINNKSGSISTYVLDKEFLGYEKTFFEGVFEILKCWVKDHLEE